MAEVYNSIKEYEEAVKAKGEPKKAPAKAEVKK